jgi:hypothetical protein
MKYFTFFRESNNFDDILTDPIIKKLIDEKIKWMQHLMIGMQDSEEKAFSYITLKYGDEMKNPVRDFSPIAGVDYVQKKDPSKFSKKIGSKK